MSENRQSLATILNNLDLLLVESEGQETEMIEAVFAQLASKVDSCVAFREIADSRAEMLRKKAQEFTLAARQVENAKQRFDDYLKKQIIEHGPIKSDLYVLNVHNGPESVVIGEGAEIPSQATKLKVEPDKARLKDLLKSGVEVPGVWLEKSVVLKVKINKGNE